MPELLHTFECPLPVSRPRAFRAWTEAGQLERWFAEFAEIEPRAGGAFRFWGRHSYETPTRRHATQRITRYEAPYAVTFTWLLHGRESEVAIRIEDDSRSAESSVLHGSHTFRSAPPITRAAELIDDLWRLTMGNLQAYLRGGSLCLPDYSDPSPHVRASIVIDAPREHVYRALLRPELLNQWIAIAAEVEPRIGGRYAFGWTHERDGVRVTTGPSRILAMIENEKLVLDWGDWRGDTTLPKQTITWLLESVGDSTRVTLLHEGFVRTTDISDYPFGWPYFLDRLRLLAQGEQPPAHEHGCSD